MIPRLVGVEEEFLLVDPDTGEARAAGGAVLRAADEDAELTGDLTRELQREQVETGTTPCRDLGALGRELRRARRTAREAARRVGVELAALATSPLPVEPTVTPSHRYQAMIEMFGLMGAEQLTCGCHVHVAVESDEECVGALDRIRPWLAPLLALSVNSPFWQGEVTGYDSYRSQVGGRWPSAGPTEPFGSAATYRAVEKAMLVTETVLDERMVYFDARCSRTHPTIEIRVPDVCRDLDDAVLIAGLVRALVETAAREWRAGTDPAPVRVEVLRLASWRAARSGLSGVLVDPRSGRPEPAADVLGALVDHVAAALEDSGDLGLVRELLTALQRRGTGAARQRAVFDRTADLQAVVRDVITTA